jgi:hypothetical protein
MRRDGIASIVESCVSTEMSYSFRAYRADFAVEQ